MFLHHRPSSGLSLGLVLAIASASVMADDFDATRWEAKVDAPAVPPPKPASKSFSIPFPGNFGGGGEVVYPAVPSPFVVIGKNFFPNDVRQVWDLSTKKQVGQFKGPLGLDDKSIALSGDGAYLAGKATHRQIVEVRQAKNGRVAQSFDTDTPFIDYVEFLGSDRVIFGHLQKRKLQICDVKSGDKVCEVEVGERTERDGIAISPGGRYLAAASPGDGRLQLFDASTGESVAEASTPNRQGSTLKCEGLAFAEDGSELAGLFEWFGSYQVVIWGAGDGKTLAHFDLEKTVARPTFYKDQGIAFFPDRSALLVLGHAVVDRQAGKKIWNLPFDDKNLKPSPRHFLDPEHAVVVTFAPSMTLRTADIPRDKMNNAASIVRAGGEAADALLPPAKSIDLSGVKHLAPPIGKAGTWGYKAPTSLAPRRLTSRVLALKNKADEARTLVVAPNASTVAAVFGSASKPGRDAPSEGLPRWVERFDLAAAKSLGSVELPGVSDPIAISPDGSRILVVESKNRGRLDLFAAGDATPIAGWRPYEKESADDRKVTWATFLDDKRVATINPAGMLVCWSIPDLRPLYVVDDAFEGAPCLGPDPGVIVGWDGRTVRVIDASTGEARAEGASPTILGPRVEVRSTAVRLDGKAFVATFGNSTIVSWDLSTGKIASEVKPSASVPVGPVEWAGDSHVLIDNRTMIDLAGKRVVWQFAGAPVGSSAPDGRHWFVARGDAGKETGRLLSADPIDPSIEKAEAMLADPNTLAVLRPGSRVSIQVDAAGPPNSPKYKDELTRALADRLKAIGMTVVDDGPPTGKSKAMQVSLTTRTHAPAPDVRLSLSVREKDTGRTINYQGIGMGRGQVEVVKMVDLVCELTLVDGSGPISCGTAYTAFMQPFGFVLRMPPGETSAEAYLKKLQWERIKDWASQSTPPYFVARDGAKVVRLPGFTDLNQVR